jgi:serine/threonine-protein kinase RsbW
MEFSEHEPEGFARLLYEVNIPSEVPAKNPVINTILETLKKKKFLKTNEDEMNLRLVLEEAIINAIRHGNGLDPAKRVKVALGETGAGWGVSVEDEGPGFKPEDLPDPDDPVAIFEEGGRGVFLMSHFMDNVIFFKGGSGVLLLMDKSTGPNARREE